MQRNANMVSAVRQDSIEKITEILSSDKVFIPKVILTREEVYEESKMMFSVVFTESLIRTAGKKGNALNIRKEMKRVLYAKSDSDIRYDCICPESKVGIVRKEVLRLINHENISNCIREIGKEAV